MCTNCYPYSPHSSFYNIANKFQPYGHMQEIYVTGKGEVTIRLAIQVLGIPKGASDRYIRTMTYLAAEEAIAIAERDFILQDAPRYRVIGTLDIQEGRMVQLDAELELTFCERK